MPPGLTHRALEWSELDDPRYLAFAERMKAAAQGALGDFEVEDHNFLQVGGVEFSVGLLTATDGTLLGGELRAHQLGCEIPDDYDDREGAYDEATLRALAAATDVSWTAYGCYGLGKDGQLERFREPDYMEWTGH